MPYFRRLFVFSTLAVSLLLTGLGFQLWKEHRALQHADLADRANIALDSLVTELRKNVDLLETGLEGIRFNERAFTSQLQRLALPPENLVFVFESGNLKYWSDNKVLPDSAMINRLPSGKVVQLGNGWYYLERRTHQTRTLIGLLLIKHQYVLQNKYLHQGFHKKLELPETAFIPSEKMKEEYPLKTSDGKVLFSIAFTSENNDDTYPLYISLLFGAGYFFGFLILFDTLRRLGRRRKQTGFILVTALFILRFIMSYFKWPEAFYESELFNSKYYASGYLLNSLGDLLLSTATVALFIVFLYSWLIRGHGEERSFPARLKIIFLFCFTFLYSVLINYVLSGLIINSQISFDINNIFQLTGYTGVGMLVIGLLLGSFYLICDGSILLIRKTNLPFSHIAILFLISQGLFLITLLLLRSTDLFTDYGVSAFLLANVLIVFIGYIRNQEMQLFSFSRNVMVILVFSIYAAQIIHTFNETREREKRQLLAAKLENEQDIVAEFLFQNLEPRIRNDRNLLRLLTMSPNIVMNSPNLIDDLGKHLDRTYFNGYLDRYEAKFKYFNKTDLPINRAGDPTWDLEEIISRNYKEGRPTSSPDFFYFRGDNGRAEYIGVLKPGANDAPIGTVVIALSARSSQDDGGFPELLLSDKVGTNRDMSKYAYARYQHGKLVNQSGAFNYYLTDGPYMQYFRKLDGMRFVSFDNHLHLFYRYEKNLIIISTPKQGFWVFVTLFSYLFTFFSFSYLLISIAARFIKEGFKLQFNFNSRIQLTIVMIVVGTLLLIGAATVTYIVDNYEQAQNNRIREKLHNIRVLVERELSNRDGLGENLGDDLQYAFNRLSATLKTDFNIYKPEGRLFFSTQPGIYEQEIIAPLMNRTALVSLTTNQKALYLQSENIGQLKYSAAYEPIRNSVNKNIGFLSLPYFDRDTELKRDISGFLVALINLYVLLFSVSILIAFFISNRITQPLRIIQDNLRRTKLGTSNEPIVWKTKDEIGALINEYNRMVAELQKSAELLAKSERESAWREMAKQVAHEIKNPLTPMKLGIQHLQRAINDNHPNKEELVRKISNTMIEQIDTLSNIATEFSHFAKMPRPEYTQVELISVLQHTCDLYVEDGDTSILFENHPAEILVRADKDQLIRIFSNLIKNALQAIPDDRKGEVQILLQDSGKEVIITVKDNGIGIPKDQLSKIFVPNFTTKSSGTGLGLAMVKAMAEGMGGQVWFETEENKGTSFFVKLVKE